MGYYEFPNTRNYDSDLGFLIKKYKELGNDYKDLVNKYELLQKIYEQIKEDIEDITKEQLQEWLDDGTLENLILQLGQIVKYFDTTINMLTQTNLTNGMIVVTGGYKNINDGGNGIFYISNTINEKDFYFSINNNLYAIYIDTKYNAISIGCDYTGNEDSSETLNKILSIMGTTGRELYIPKGTYIIDEPLIILNEIDIKLDSDTIIKANSEMDYMLGINPNNIAITGNTLGLLRVNIQGGIFNCNSLATNGIVANTYYHSSITNLTVENFKGNGIMTRYTDISISSAYLYVNNCILIGDPVYGGQCGYYGAQPDNTVENTSVIDCVMGFLLATSNHANNCTAWLKNPTLYQNSMAYRCQSGPNCTINNCTSDTMRYSIYLALNSLNCLINNLIVMNNNNVITPTESNIPTIFFIQNQSDTILFKVNGITIDYNFNFNMTNMHGYRVCNEINNVIIKKPNYLQNSYNAFTMKSTENENYQGTLYFYDECYHLIIENTNNIVLTPNQTIYFGTLGILPSTYTKILGAVLIDSNRNYANVNIFFQNGNVYLHNLDESNNVTITNLFYDYIIPFYKVTT